jgi:exonuclease III
LEYYCDRKHCIVRSFCFFFPREIFPSSNRITDWLHKQDPTFCCLQQTQFREKDRYYLRVKGWKTIFQANVPKKQAGVAILISKKINLQPKVIKKDKEEHFILIKDKIFQDEFSTLNIYATNRRTSKIIKETQVKLKAYGTPHTIIVGDFSTAISSMDRSWKHKLNRNTVKITEVMKKNGFNISTEHVILKQKDIHFS